MSVRTRLLRRVVAAAVMAACFSIAAPSQAARPPLLHVTDDPYARAPQFGADGSLYYISTWSLRVVPPGGTTSVALAPGTPVVDMSVSPDGQQIALGNGYLFVMQRDGTGLRLLTFGSSPTWSPDGSHLIFSRLTGEGGQYGELWRINVDGSGLRQLTFTGSQANQSLYSPDGQWVAFPQRDFSCNLCDYYTWIMRPDGSDQHLLGGVSWPIAGDRPFGWSPDSQHLVTMWFDSTSDRAGFALWTPAGERTALLPGVPGVPGPPAAAAVAATFSPNGRDIGFWGYNHAGPVVGVIGTNGRRVRLLATGMRMYWNGGGNVWRPDGLAMAVIGFQDGIYLIGVHYAVDVLAPAATPTVNTIAAGHSLHINVAVHDAFGAPISRLEVLRRVLIEPVDCAAFSTVPGRRARRVPLRAIAITTANQLRIAVDAPSAPGCYSAYLKFDEGTFTPIFLRVRATP